MPDILNVFDNDAFHVMTMSDALKDEPYIPGALEKMGLFQTTSVSTLDIAIEKAKAENIFLIRESPRGGPGQTFGKTGRSMRKLTVPHFQVDDAIYADEVMQVRAFGEDRALETFTGRVAERAAEARQSFALTQEFHRLNVVINGKMIDSDGTTVIYDFFDEMGEAQPAAVDWNLDAGSPVDGDLRQKSTNLTRAMGTALGGLPFNGIIALTGDNFWDALVKHKEVRDTYKNINAAMTLRQAVMDVSNQSAGSGIWGSFPLFDITWVNYRGGFGVEIPTDEARFVPIGVPGLFRTVYAPADYIETVNTMGKQLYVKTIRMPNDKGVSVEMQQNVLHYVTRPRVLMRATLT